MARAQDTVNTVCNNVINSLDCGIFDNKPICASNGVQYNTEYECSHARTKARTYTHARTRKLKGMGSNIGQRSCSWADWFQVVIILREVTASTKQRNIHAVKSLPYCTLTVPVYSFTSGQKMEKQNKKDQTVCSRD